MIEIAHKYFEAFQNKNLELLSQMLADDVELVDWENSCRGKAEVLAIFESIFAEFRSIELNILDEYKSNLTSVFELRISFDKGLPLKICDILKVNFSGEIVLITAYRQF